MLFDSILCTDLLLSTIISNRPTLSKLILPVYIKRLGVIIYESTTSRFSSPITQLAWLITA